MGLVPKAAAFFFFAILLAASSGSASAGRTIGHEITAVIHPEKHSLSVEDRITLPEEYLKQKNRSVRFLINGAFTVSSPTTGVRLIHRRVPQEATPIPLMEYSLDLPTGRNDFVLNYRGHVDNPPGKGDSVRAGPDASSGFINPEGVQLEGNTYWYPWFGDDLITFGLEVRMPGPWKVVSQGARIMDQRDADGSVRTRWVSPEPQDEILLFGGRFKEYDRERGGVVAMAFLRTPDDALAAAYLDATFEYLDEFDRLIGPYPYKKFALVENIAETGFGMPSLTLLGPHVIRLPFILHSSYPHEILHNWWGNGVYVDYASGNWSEGLTAYLADHLIKEQNGAGAEYRRSALQKYADYVTNAKDFPLTEFRSRHGSVTEAVGYGKTMMFFHMLRLELGDEIFTRALRTFYENNKFRRASFSDVQSAFSRAAGRDLKPEFDQWINRPGAPVLRVGRVHAAPDGKAFRLTATLEQTQKGKGYVLSVPIAVQMEGSPAPYQTTVHMDRKRLKIDIRLTGRPWRLDVDPEFDVFRRLDRFEIPPALSQPFGAEKVLVVLPSRAPKEIQSAYRHLAEALTGGARKGVEIRLDSELKVLPANRHVWVLGWENRFLKSVRSAVAGYGASVSSKEARIGGTRLDRKRNAVVLTARNPRRRSLSLSWLAADNPAAFPGLERKLPHYGRFGYLAFEGDEPENILKGDWPVTDSPMSAAVKMGGKKTAAAKPGALKPRRALVYPAETESGGSD
jgi:aminopeptidase N